MLILLVEDNSNDTLLTYEAVEEVCKAGYQIELHSCTNGLDAIAYLQNGGKPRLILLDLNMPKMGGLQFLSTIKAPESAWKRIPVCVLTTSNSDIDIIGSYDRYCASYLQKPVEFDDFVAVLKKLGDFWFKTAILAP